MTAVEGLPPSPVPRGPADHDQPLDRVAGLCPYLASADGSWRSIHPAREHRCAAVSPPVPLTIDKQRRLCLSASHVDCATYRAAIDAHSDQRPSPANRPIVRMTPVVLDQARFELRIPEIRADRATGQAVLVGALAVALAVLLLARPGGDAGTAANGAAGSSPGAGAAPVAIVGSPSASPEPEVSSPAPTPTATTPPAPTPPAPTPVASQVASAAPIESPAATPSPAPSTSGATYRVRSGDTLVAIAARFDTTVSVLVDLNDIDDPARLKVGQILKLP